jgi:2-oxoglutarate ferredoxin oxidoreductase subunit gamma
MTQRIICAGFGGQGVLLVGQVITYAGMIEGKEVSWLPSYGPEMRGGTANCSVIISDEPVGAPIVTKADVAIVMNKPSLEKFEDVVVPGGNLFINESLIDDKCLRDDIDVIYVKANAIATEIGNVKVANVVMLGAYLEKCGIVSFDSVIEGLRKVLGEKKEKLIPINKIAIKKGGEVV